jgi:hypothetical protein
LEHAHSVAIEHRAAKMRLGGSSAARVGEAVRVGGKISPVSP